MDRDRNPLLNNSDGESEGAVYASSCCGRLLEGVKANKVKSFLTLAFVLILLIVVIVVAASVGHKGTTSPPEDLTTTTPMMPTTVNTTTKTTTSDFTTEFTTDFTTSTDLTTTEATTTTTTNPPKPSCRSVCLGPWKTCSSGCRCIVVLCVAA